MTKQYTIQYTEPMITSTYKQTGLEQIGPIHPPPSFLHNQAITRTLTNRQFKEGLRLTYLLAFLLLIDVEFQNVGEFTTSLSTDEFKLKRSAV